MESIPNSTFGTIIAVSIAAIPFFITSALDRVEELDDDGFEGYAKFATLLAIIISYSIMLYVIGITFSIWGQLNSGLLLTALYFIFIALYLPSLFLLIPAAATLFAQLEDPDQNRHVQLVIALAIGVVSFILVDLNPGP